MPISGDGSIHEIFNGLAARPDGLAALARIPIVPIPGGSANSLCVNLLGPETGMIPSHAAVNAIKGKTMPLDLCSITQGSQISFSFLTQAFGLMADLDLGTEHLR